MDALWRQWQPGIGSQRVQALAHRAGTRSSEPARPPTRRAAQRACASCAPSQLDCGSLTTPNQTQGYSPTAATMRRQWLMVVAVGQPSAVLPLRSARTVDRSRGAQCWRPARAPGGCRAALPSSRRAATQAGGTAPPSRPSTPTRRSLCPTH